MKIAPADHEPARERRFASFESASAAFKPALYTVGPYAAFGLFTGAFILSVQIAIETSTKAEGWHHFCRILEHLGAGFLVSSIAVFLYEWGAEAKHLIDITAKLTRFIDSDVRPILNAAADNFLSVNLNALAPKSGHIGDSFQTILRSFIEIEKSQAWNKQVYFDFLNRSLLDLATISSESALLASETTSHANFSLPHANASAVSFLCDQIKCMREGDIYSALSDVESWRYLDRFVEAQKTAVVTKGISIRRVFVLPTRASPDTSQLVAQHWKFATEWSRTAELAQKPNRYQIRVVTRDKLRSIARSLQRKHYGVFNNVTDERTLVYEVPGEDLSEFSLSTIATNHSLLRDYEKVWDRLAGQTSSEIADALLATTVSALDRGWTYLVVSDFLSWDGLESFHKACLQATYDKDLSIHRVFVRQPNDDKRLVQRVLRKHLGESNQGSRQGSYLIRLCDHASAVAEFGERWQFGFFKSPGGQSEQIGFAVTETHDAGVSNYYMDAVVPKDARVEQFPGFWNKSRVVSEETIPAE